MSIKLKNLLKESREDIRGLAFHLGKKIRDLEEISPGNELTKHLREFWNTRVILWHEYVYLKGYELEEEIENRLKNDILDWILRARKEIEAIKK